MSIDRNVRGLLGTKLGMTQTWDENNRVVPVTVISAVSNVVTQVRLPDTDGYSAVQIGFGEIDGRKVTCSTSAPLTPTAMRSVRRSQRSCSRPARPSTSPARARAKASPE
jgi:ribosomal protein L3